MYNFRFHVCLFFAEFLKESPFVEFLKEISHGSTTYSLYNLGTVPHLASFSQFLLHPRPSGCSLLVGSLHLPIHLWRWFLAGIMSCRPFHFPGNVHHFQLLLEDNIRPGAGHSEHQLSLGRVTWQTFSSVSPEIYTKVFLGSLWKIFPLDIRWVTKTRCYSISTVPPPWNYLKTPYTLMSYTLKSTDWPVLAELVLSHLLYKSYVAGLAHA